MWQKIIDFFGDKSEWPSLLPTYERPSTPRSLFGPVFDVVQLSMAFKDSKTFVDMVPKKSAKKIARAYASQYGVQLDVRRFVNDNFAPPKELPEPAFAKEGKELPADVRDYIEEMWGVLTREPDVPNKYSSLLSLPHPYIVPGGRFREIYYWDSYFTMLGLRESGHNELLETMVKNMAYLVSRYGFIPNGNRSYYLTRSQPPVFSQMVSVLAEVKGQQILQEYLPFIVSEYKYWMRGGQYSSFKNNLTGTREHVVRMPDGEILNRYFDEAFSPRDEGFREDLEIGRHHYESANFYRNVRAGAESGWDFSTRWFEDGGDLSTVRVLDIVPVDLNTLLYLTEDLLSRIYQSLNNEKLTVRYSKLAERRRDAILKYCWDEKSGWFHDYVITESKRQMRPNIAGVYPLFAGIASPEQAARVAENVEDKFLRPGGVVTTLENSGEQWDAPNGWAPLQYVTVMGLDRYGSFDLAKEVATRWCNLNIRAYKKTGLLLEKYNVEDLESLAGGGEYELQDGFGWTNAVLLTLMNKYHMTGEKKKKKKKKVSGDSQAEVGV